jgi:DNA replication protein DnaC
VVLCQAERSVYHVGLRLPSLDRNRIPALAQLDFIDRHEVVHLIGQSGTGNSHLAFALGVEVRAGSSV